MARDRATVFLTIWNDPDFRTLSGDAQWLYFTMLTHPTLAYTGVMEWHEKKLTAMRADLTAERLREAAWELGQRRMIAVDADTGEALVRSFVRHDGVLKSPNVAKGMVRQHASIASLRLMELVSREVRRAIEEDPSLKGAEAAAIVAKQFPEPIADGFVYVPEPFRKGSDPVPERFDPGSDPVPESVNQSCRNPSDLVPTVLPPTTSTYVESHGTANAAPMTDGRTRPRRATRIPDPFPITPEMVAWAKDNVPGLDHQEVTNRFVDYWSAVPGSKGVKLDWPATWRNWLRRTADTASGTGLGRGTPRTSPDASVSLWDIAGKTT